MSLVEKIIYTRMLKHIKLNISMYKTLVESNPINFQSHVFTTRVESSKNKQIQRIYVPRHLMLVF